MTNKAAEISSTTTVWLQEAVRLQDMIMHFVDAGLVGSYIDARDAFRRLPWRCPGSTVSTTPEEWRRRSRHDELHKACVTPLVDALNWGRIIAARPDYGSSKFIRLLPPGTGWCFRVYDLDKSLIFDPKKWDHSLFVLFMFADREPAVALEPAKNVGPIETTVPERQFSRLSTKMWLESAVRRIPPDDRRRGWKRRYAKNLAAIMAEEAKTNRGLKPSASTSIVTRLGEHKLWPQ